MIYCSVSDLYLYSELSPLFKVCIDYILHENLKALPMGKTEIYGDKIYVNKMELETECIEDAVFESHKKYIDIHIDLIGSECIGFTEEEIQIKKAYDEEADVVLYAKQQKLDYKFDLSNSKCLVFMPGEKHMPGIKIGNKKVLKCCFKVSVM